MKSKFLFLILFTLTFNSSFAQWSAPQNISPGTTAVGTNENAGQCIAVVGDTVRITYSDRSTAMAKIMYNQSTDMGITWGTPVQLFSSLNCGFTAIASCGSSVHIVWMDSLGSDRASFYKRSSDNGATWGPTVCLDSVTKFWPGIACSNNLVIATLNKDLSGNTEVFIKRSLDTGSTWLTEQRISNATNRSEDPAINILGGDVHLSWNDKRSDTMNIYYCHSSDSGATWGPETQLTTIDSYTSMVCLDGNHVDVPHGIRTAGAFDVWNSESNDTGSTRLPDQQLTNTPALGEIYPFMVRDGLNMHLVYIGPGGANYLYSADGGVSWDVPLLLSASTQPFIAYTGCVLHVIFANGGHINYMRNPTGNSNCSVLGTNNFSENNFEASVFPNPFTSEATITFSESQKNTALKISDAIGREIKTINFTGRQITIDLNIKSGIYFVQVSNERGTFTSKLIKE